MEVIIWKDKDITEIPRQDNPFNSEETRSEAIVICESHIEPGKTIGERMVFTWDTDAGCAVLRGQFARPKDAKLFADVLAFVRK